LGYLEFHIEQGPVLDMLHRPIAVVDGIVGRSCVDVVFIGAAGHAGTTPMGSRRDALAGAALWICRVEEAARRTPGLVATTGQIEVVPGAANVIAGSCRVSVDVRHADDRVRTAAVARIREAAEAITTDRQLRLEWTTRVECPATRLDAALVETLSQALETIGLPAMRMPSGAGHDAVIVAPHIPAAMLFVRSPGGVSHHPDEAVLDDDVSLALAAGMAFLDRLAARSHTDEDVMSRSPSKQPNCPRT
jgi:allantoate deiminase